MADHVKHYKLLCFSVFFLLALSACGGANTPAATSAPTTEPITVETEAVESEPTQAVEAAAETEAAEVAQAETSEPTEPAEPTPTPVVESNVDNSASAASNAGSNAKLLAWIGQGAEATSSSPGQLVLVEEDGSFGPLLQAPEATRRVFACGDEATSPDGQTFAFYMGGADTGKLYAMSGSDVPIEVGDIEALACLGNGTFQYAPDSSRFAYIAYDRGWNSEEYAAGTLRVISTGTLEEQASFDNVTAFDISSAGTAYVTFFTNENGEVDEAAVNWWDGSAEREIATVQPDGEDCRFTNSQIGIAPDGNFVMIMGHRCKSGDNTGTRWQFYTVNVEEQNVNMAASDLQPGAFLPYSRSNNIFFSEDGQTTFYTVPDGVTAYTVALAAMNMGTMTPDIVIERQAIMPNYSGTANSAPVISPDGQWMATVVTTPNNENTLRIINLADPSIAPITYDAASRGDVISAMTFTPDSQALLFVEGSESSNRDGDNSLFSLNLSEGTASRIARGLFGPEIIVSPDGSTIAATDVQVPDDNREPTFSNLVEIALDGAKTPLIEGGEITDGKVNNQQFIYPLAWRPA